MVFMWSLKKKCQHKRRCRRVAFFPFFDLPRLSSRALTAARYICSGQLISSNIHRPPSCFTIQFYSDQFNLTWDLFIYLFIDLRYLGSVFWFVSACIVLSYECKWGASYTVAGHSVMLAHRYGCVAMVVRTCTESICIYWNEAFIIYPII